MTTTWYSSEPTEQDYANAAAALWATEGITEAGWNDQADTMTDPAFRAAVDVAFGIGWRAGREAAAKAIEAAGEDVNLNLAWMYPDQAARIARDAVGRPA